MSKISNLDLVLDEMITAGQKMIDAATALKEVFSDAAPDVSQTETKTEKKETPDPAPEAKTYTFTEVRSIMASLAGNGKKAEAKALLAKFGATRLSDIKEEDYAALVSEAQVIANV